ncbi:hypothetical protein [Streptomyces peucetius]
MSAIASTNLLLGLLIIPCEIAEALTTVIQDPDRRCVAERVTRTG